MKNSGTPIGQERAELALEIMGAQGLGWEGDGFSADELTAVRGWLSGKADDHLRRLAGDPEQHHRQTHPGPSRHHPFHLNVDHLTGASRRGYWRTN